MDFKREFTYEDTYLVWETIWASSHVVSSHFYLFVALALVETYRDIILGIFCHKFELRHPLVYNIKTEIYLLDL